jgi:ABC-type molybdate transport system substrate-binding protein
MSSLKHRLMIFSFAAGMVSLAASANAATCAPGMPQLIIYHAGSLSAAFAAVEQLFTHQTGVCVTDVAAGSVDAARRITTGQEPCDIFASADFEIIDLMLKPAGFADYDILFGQGGMVLAYTTSSENAATITASGGVFNPPASVPAVADDWYLQLMQPGVAIGGSHPFLDPSGYRADLIFQLANQFYHLPNLYDLLLEHYSVIKATDALGKTYDYQFIYEHSALAAYNADATKSYRYAKLPDEVSLSNPQLNRRYRKAAITIPGLGFPDTDTTVSIPGTRVVWGLTVLKSAANPDNALKFLQLLFSPQGVGLQTAPGPAPIRPPIVNARDFERLPHLLRPLVRAQRGDDR